MGENALNEQIIHPGHFLEFLHGLLMVVGEKAQPRHPRVQLDVDSQTAVQSLEAFVERPGILQTVDLLADAHFCQILGVFYRRIAQNQNRAPDAVAAQLGSLLKIGDGQKLRAQLFQVAADGNRAVAVGVGLDHAEKAALRRELFPQGVIIVIQIVQGYLCPGPL